jgi:hypothetical protein
MPFNDDAEMNGSVNGHAASASPSLPTAMEEEHAAQRAAHFGQFGYTPKNARKGLAAVSASSSGSGVSSSSGISGNDGVPSLQLPSQAQQPPPPPRTLTPQKPKLTAEEKREQQQMAKEAKQRVRWDWEEPATEAELQTSQSAQLQRSSEQLSQPAHAAGCGSCSTADIRSKAVR